MRYSNTTLTELTTRYKHILMKCAYLNAAIIVGAMIATPAFAAPTIITTGISNNTETNPTKAGGLTIDHTDQVQIADNVTYSTNTATGSGGAIKALDGFTAGNGLNITGNHSDAIGGGMYIRLADHSTGETVPQTLDVKIGNNAVFEGNSSKFLGGGLAIESAKTVTIGDGAQFISNASLTDGGGMAVYTDSTNSIGTVPVTTGATVNLGKTTFTSNMAANRGGAIANLNNDTTKTSYDNTVNVGAGSSFEGNSAQYGGAIYNMGELNIGSGTNFTNNSAVVGGAIYIHEPGTMALGDNIVFSGNTADYNKESNPSAGNVNASGSAIHARNGFAAGNGVQFINNHVTQKVDSIWMGGTIYASLEKGDAKTITFGDDTLFKGNTSNASAGAVYLADKASMTFGKNTIFDGNTADKYAGAVMNQNVGNILTFNGDSSFTNNTAGLGGGAIVNNGTINFNGNTTFANNMASGVKNDILNTGILNFGDGIVSLDGGITGKDGGKTGTVTFGDKSTLRVTLMSNASPFIVADTVTIAKGAKLDLIVGNGVSDGQYTIGDVNTLTDGQRFELANKENALYSFIQNVDKGIYDVTKKSTAAITEALTSQGASATEAQTIGAMTEAKPTNAQATAIADAITTAAQTGDTAGAAALASAANPTTTPVVQTQAVGTATQIMNVAGNRMSAAGKGRSGGSMADFAYGPWIQGLYNKTHNSQGVGFDGYTQGFALGADVDVTDAIMVGAGYGYTATDINSNGRKTNVYGDNYFIYGKYQPSEWYTSGTLNYGHGNYHEKSLGLTSKYNVDTYAAEALVGYQTGIFDNYAGVRYIYVNPDSSYSNGLTEVKTDNTQVGTAIIGTKISKDYTCRGIIWKPEFRIAGTYDVKSDNSSSVVNVVGGSTTYSVSGGRLHRAALESGVGLTATVKNLDVILGYDTEWRSEQFSQTGSVKLQYNF